MNPVLLYAAKFQMSFREGQDERLKRQGGANRVLTDSILEMRRELVQLRSKLKSSLEIDPGQATGFP